MPITINGTGTITGISAGGLPDDSIIAADIAAGAVTTAKVADANITAAKLDGAIANGICKAWVNFNGSGVIAILASFNTSSITDNANGDYTMNFTTAMTDANFSAVMTSSPKVGTNGQYNIIVAPITSTTNAAGTRTRSASSIRMRSEYTNIDAEDVNVAIFR